MFNMFKKKPKTLAVVIDNSALLKRPEDTEYGNKRALFLHALLLSHSEHNYIDGKNLITTSNKKLGKMMMCGRKQIDYSMRTLVSAGYVDRIKNTRGVEGYFVSTTWEIHESNDVQLREVTESKLY